MKYVSIFILLGATLGTNTQDLNSIIGVGSNLVFPVAITWYFLARWIPAQRELDKEVQAAIRQDCEKLLDTQATAHAAIIKLILDTLSTKLTTITENQKHILEVIRGYRQVTGKDGT